MYATTLTSVEYLSGLKFIPVSARTLRSSAIRSVILWDRSCSRRLRSDRRFTGFFGPSGAEMECSFLLLLMEVLLREISEDVGAGGSDMGGVGAAVTRGFVRLAAVEGTSIKLSDGKGVGA